MHPTNKDEVAAILSSPDKNKSIGPYSLPNNIFIPLKIEISNPLADLFSLFVASDIFPSILTIS